MGGRGRGAGGVKRWEWEIRKITLIGLGEVNVDLANFDLKLQENLLGT